MQARAATLGADIRVESHLGAGTRLVLTLPIFEPPTA
jgi:signal transduction histidine kinase